MLMEYEVLYDPAFEEELLAMGKGVRQTLLAKAELLGDHGPQLRRPHADKLKGSRHSNMKELRFDARGGKWRVAFAFDPERKAILLVAGNKMGVNQDRFYKSLIATADERYDQHLEELKRGS